MSYVKKRQKYVFDSFNLIYKLIRDLLYIVNFFIAISEYNILKKIKNKLKKSD
jgi:hypothetical protein